jgi:hypothetical protein
MEVVKFPGFGRAYIFNAEGEHLKQITTSLSRLARLDYILDRQASIRVKGRGGKILSDYIQYKDTNAPDFEAPLIDSKQEECEAGLFYIDNSGQKELLYIESYPPQAGILDFRPHVNFFEDLVKVGKLKPGKFTDYPRGFTEYDEGNAFYLVTGGNYLTQSLAEQILTKFGYSTVWPWSYFMSPSYVWPPPENAENL